MSDTGTPPTTEAKTTSFVDMLASAKGDNWKDPETIAKGKLEADAHIAELNAKLAALEAKQSDQDKFQMLLDKLEGKAASPVNANPQVPDNDNGTGEMNTTSQPSEQDIQSLVEKTLKQREDSAVAERNMSEVLNQLQNKFGDRAMAHLNAKAQELGVSVEELEGLAKKSPQAFFNTIGEQEVASFNALSNATIRTEGVTQSGSKERNQNYYSEMRKTNPKMFYDAKTQDTMAQDRIRLGDSFYS